MKITNKEVLKQLGRVQNGELEELLKSFPEDERDGRSDMQILYDESEYLLGLYNEEGTRHHRELKAARAVLRETKNGKSMPLLLPSFQPKYSKQEIEECIAITGEYRRLSCLLGRLAKQHY